jgi:hypothetical protein
MSIKDSSFIIIYKFMNIRLKINQTQITRAIITSKNLIFIKPLSPDRLTSGQVFIGHCDSNDIK